MVMEVINMRTRAEIEDDIRRLKADLQEVWDLGAMGAVYELSGLLRRAKAELTKFQRVNGQTGWGRPEVGRSCRGPK